MIAYLKGTLHSIMNQQLILETHGVGYLVTVSQSCVEHLPKMGKDLELFIYTAVRDDDIALFGFQEEVELHFFKKLLSVSGVGAKTALSILNQPLDLTLQAIFQGDHPFLTSLPGIGKKTAARIILELQGKIDPEDLTPSSPSPKTPHLEEALQALLNLGYEKTQVLSFIRDRSPTVKSAEDLVTAFLRSA